jgi:flagellar hook protein FlgE
MGFATALSGLDAASTSLQVIGNNISNANTTGFKESRAEFADVYNSTGSATPGAGVRVSEVAQQFHQGNVEATQNNLDLALSGNGFFALGETDSSAAPSAYTRNGAFHLSPEGYVINDKGRFLLGGSPKGTTVAAGFNTLAPQPIKIDTAQGAPSATTQIDLKVNLDSRDGLPLTTPFIGYDSTTSTGPNIDTYNSSTSATIFDSLGNIHTLATYFVDETPSGSPTSIWGAYLYLDGKGINIPNPATGTATLDDLTPVTGAADLIGTRIPMTFDALGNLNPLTTGTDTGTTDDNFLISNLVINPTVALGVPAQPLTFSISPTGSTQYASNFGVNDLQQNGFASGNLTGISVDKTGVVLAKYSNGTSSPLAQVLLGRFTSNQSLDKIGDTTWQESVGSGTVVLGVAGGNNFGDITSSALENSNVDIAKQLVGMIVAQQAYQANAQTIQTEDEVIQRLLQL